MLHTHIILKQKPDSNQYLIFLCCPAIESWLLSAAKEANVKAEDYNINSEMKYFKRVTKNQNISKNKDFMDFLRAIKKANPESFNFMRIILDKLQKK